MAISGDMSKAFSRYLKSIEIKTLKTSFHSFRHNFEDAALVGDGRADVLDALQGHSAEGMRGRYGTGNKSNVYSLSLLQETIERITYPSIDFDKLKRFSMPL